ncbi:MAG: hypothetical protein ACLTJG_20695 [[Clostridium] innocuum]
MSRDIKNALGIGVILFLVLFVFGSFCPIERIFGIPCPGCNCFLPYTGCVKEIFLPPGISIRLYSFCFLTQ